MIEKNKKINVEDVIKTIKSKINLDFNFLVERISDKSTKSPKDLSDFKMICERENKCIITFSNILGLIDKDTELVLLSFLESNNNILDILINLKK